MNCTFQSSLHWALWVGLKTVFIHKNADRDSTQTHTVVWMQQYFFMVKKNDHSRVLEQNNACLLWGGLRKMLPQLLFRMFCASEVVCKFDVLHEQYHGADRFLGIPGMFDIHVISCCALRVDSTCCCLALHTIWNPFTYFCVTCLPSSAAVQPYKVSPCAKSSPMCVLWTAEGKRWNALKGFQRLLLKSGVSCS